MTKMSIKHNLIHIVQIMAVILLAMPVSLVGEALRIAKIAEANTTQRVGGPQDDSVPPCEAGKEYDAGLCYPVCQTGYRGVGPVCWQQCPAGSIDDGALCRINAIITAKESYGRGAGTPLGCSGTEDKDGALCYPKCNAGYSGVGPMCWQQCPSGYTDDGLTCRRDAHIFGKDSYGRGVGTIPPIGGCGSGKENVAGLCYPVCRAGYYGAGLFCYQYCPSGYTDDGLTCRRDAHIFGKDSYGRGVGTPLHACGTGQEKDGALCYPVCQVGYSGVGPVCYKQCPAGYTDDGALCRKDAVITAKASYGRGVGTVPNCDINNKKCTGNFEAFNNFRANPDGYEFKNWGGSTYDDSTDFDVATMVRMFGVGVCQNGTTEANCVLSAAARTWRESELASWRGGHCYGLAASSQLFFAGLDSQSKYQAGATSTYGLNSDAAVRAHISEMASSQNLVLADGSASGYIKDKKPSEVLGLIRTGLRDKPTDPYVLAFFQSDANGAFTAGHAVTPFAIANKGGGVYWLHIYDNNWPKDDRYIVFDTTNETWLYGFGATNPAEPVGAWRGDANTQSLQLRPTSAHKLSGWYCDYCFNRSLNANSPLKVSIAPTVQFRLIGAGSLLVRDQQDKAIGWDADAKKYVNDIVGAELQNRADGGGTGNTSIIRLPLQNVSAPYKVYANGDSLTQTVAINLMMIGPGYTVDVKNIALTPNQRLFMTFRPDGRQITFNANNSGLFTPTIRLATDLATSGNGYVFDVGGITLAPSKTVTVSLDLENNALRFTDNSDQADALHINLLRITPKGQEQRYETNAVTLTIHTEGAMNFGNWDGSGPMPFVLDGITQTVKNQVQLRFFLPLLLKQ